MTDRAAREFVQRPTTRELMAAISELAGIPVLEPGVGSTEPAEFFVSLAQALGIEDTDQHGRRLSKPVLAKVIVEAADLPWDQAWDGSLTLSGGGGSVSNDGLSQLLSAVEVLMGRRDPRANQPWGEAEIAIALAAYYDLLINELQGVYLVKRQVVSDLMDRLPGRSRGSVDLKLRNVSAVLHGEGLPWVDGYKPAGNFQAALRDAVLIDLDGTPPLRALLVGLASRSDPADVPDSLASREVSPPSTGPQGPGQPPGSTVVPSWKGAFRDAENRDLGSRGEEWVVRLERERLVAEGLRDLAEAVEWVAQTQGDGLGYDVLSWSPLGEPRWLEVKTTNGGRSTPFLLTRNELAVWRDNQDRFQLVRLFAFAGSPRFYRLHGSPDDLLDLREASWEARPR